MKSLRFVSALILATAPPAAQAAYGTGLAVDGPGGIGRLTDASAGDPGLRLGLRGGFFQGTGFLVAGSTDRQMQGELLLGWSPAEEWELFGAYRSSSSSSSKGTPHLLQAHGDILLGLKRAFGFPGGAVALDLRLDLRNGNGNDLPERDTSAIQVRGLLSRSLGPVRLHGNVGGSIGASKTARDSRMDVVRQFGSGLSGYHRLMGGVGIEIAAGPVVPYLTADADYPVGVDKASLPRNGSVWDVAAKHAGGGLRILAGRHALDLQGEAGWGTGASGYSKTPPYQVQVAWSFSFPSAPPHPPAQPVVERLAQAPAPLPPPAPAPAAAQPTTGSIVGRVLDAGSGTPVASAIVLTQDRRPVATDRDGSFATHEMKPGSTTLSVVREGYRPAKLETRVVAGLASPLDIRLERLPPPELAPPIPPPPAAPAPAAPASPMGFVAGRLEGLPLGASSPVRAFGPETRETETEADGSFAFKLMPGSYLLVAAPRTLSASLARVTVVADRAVPVMLHTGPRSGAGLVQVEENRVVPTNPFTLDERVSEPAKPDLATLDELADLVIRDPSRRLVLEVHSDSPKGGGDRKAWSEERARAFKDALIRRGVPADLVVATGRGIELPIAPSIGRMALRNRRVELFFEPPANAPDATRPQPGIPTQPPRSTPPSPAPPAQPPEPAVTPAPQPTPAPPAPPVPVIDPDVVPIPDLAP